jgi:predicted porin
MKKLLIASAALAMVAGTAQAQSSVQVYGVMDIGYGETKNVVTGSSNSTNGTRKTTTTGNGDGGLATSRLGFQGSEDLGGGTKANFRLEYDLTDVGAGGNTLGARESWVSLSDAKLGELKLGRQATGSHGVIANFSAGMANNTVGAIYSMGTGANTTTMPNESGIRPHNVYGSRLVGYTSPNMGGVVLSAQYGENSLDTVSTTDRNPKTKMSDLAVRYNAGKLALGASYQKQETEANSLDAAGIDTATNTGTGTTNSAAFATSAGGAINTGAGTIKYETTMVGASYNFGVVQPFALWTEKKVDYSTLTAANGTSSTGTALGANDGAKGSATEIGLRAPLGAKAMVLASMYDGEVKFQSGKDDLKGYQLGALYNMSKRTALYAITGKQEVKGTGTDSAYKVKTTGMSAGVRHSF